MIATRRAKPQTKNRRWIHSTHRSRRHYVHSNRKIQSFYGMNNCKRAAHSQRCYDFVAQCLGGSHNTRIKCFSYGTVARRAPIMTINDATRFATIIAQVNDNLKALTIISLHGKSNDHDPYLDVFI